jgi:hypothetical protein
MARSQFSLNTVGQTLGTTKNPQDIGSSLAPKFKNALIRKVAIKTNCKSKIFKTLRLFIFSLFLVIEVLASMYLDFYTYSNLMIYPTQKLIVAVAVMGLQGSPLATVEVIYCTQQ